MWKRRAHGVRQEAGTLSKFRRAWHVLGALLLATGALGLLSIQAVRREAVARRNLVVDAHRGVADLVSARLDVAMADDERAITEAIDKHDPGAEALVNGLAKVEASRPWLRPLVVVRQRGDTESAQPSQLFETLLTAAEHEEHALRRFDAAIRLYTRAVAEAPLSARKLEALNGVARTEFKAGRLKRSAEVSQQIVTTAESLDADQARWVMLARDRLVECDAAVGNADGQRQHALALYDFLVRFHYVLDRDAAKFYARRAAQAISPVPLAPAQQETWQRLRDREALLSSFDDTVLNFRSTTGRGPRASIAYPLDSHVEATLQRVLRERGPWSDRGVALVDAAGRQRFSSVPVVPADAIAATVALAQPANWRVLTFPQSGSLADLAARDAARYGLWLLLVFGTVVAALVLAARSVSRELTLARLRAEFVAGVSHELKTPLSLIRMFGESLREGWVAEPQKQDYYEVITRESERLTGLINNVLDFSRLESGTRRYSFETVDLRQLVQDLLDRYEFHLRAARIELVRHLPDRPVQARVDRDAIEQVIVNLLSNAVKYMGELAKPIRQVRVFIGHEGQQVVLRVSDTGIGMSDEHRPHIFERFYRSDDERVQSVAGSGLGLTLVKAHIDAHAGTIVVDSTPDLGSTFAISLPLAPTGTES